MTADATDPGDGWVLTAAAGAPDDWPSLLDIVPEADYSHTRHWHESVCAHRPGARQLWLTARRGSRLLGGMAAVVAPAAGRLGRLPGARRLESSVGGTSGGPLLHPELATPDRRRLFSALIRAYRARRPGGLAAATMSLNPQSEVAFGPLLQSERGWHRQESPTAMISLAGGLDAVDRERLVMNKRNERNRGLRRGAEVLATRDPELLAAYYPIHVAASAHWGVPAVPLGLLRDLLADPQDRVFLTCVRVDGKVIGGHLCLHLGERVFAWNGVTDPAYARTHFPATLCFWGDMTEACRRGALWLDCGASGGIQSLSRFKRYFGAELMPRGFYVSESFPLRALRKATGLVGRSGGGRLRRWHDRPRARAGDGGAA